MKKKKVDDIQDKLDESKINLNNAESELKRSEASLNDLECSSQEVKTKLDIIETLSRLLTDDVNPFSDLNNSGKIIDDELDRAVIKAKIIEIVKKL